MSSFHYTFCTINYDGSPHTAPLGSLVLDKTEPRGYFFEVFTSNTARNLEKNPNICVMAVNSSKAFWLKFLLRGKFSESPGVRLTGTAGKKREATPEEIARFRKLIRTLKFTPGYKTLWGNVKFVRDIEFTRYETVKLGKTTHLLWH